MRAWTAIALICTIGVGLTGCGGDDLEGFLWDVSLLVDGDTGYDDCHPDGEGIGYDEAMTYRLVFDGSYAELAIEDQTFATGAISGCLIEYESVVWGQAVDGYDVRWQLFGEASYRQGAGCDSAFDDKDLDWEGTETFVIKGGDHPDIPIGCEYQMEVTGSYVGPAGG